MKEQDEETTAREHPSYGVLRMTRIHGGTGQLFGSTLDHFSRVRFTVCRARLDRDLGHDRIYPQDELVVFEMSSAQFAEALLSVGLGEGTPCTLRYLDRVDQGECPQDSHERAKIKKEFHAQMQQASDRMAQGESGLEDILAKKSLTNADRASIREIIRGGRRLFVDQLAFTQSCFAEAAERTLQATRTEATAFVSSLVEQAGLEHLSGTRETPLALSSKKEPDAPS